MDALSRTKSQIISVGTFLPETVVTSEEMLSTIGSEEKYGIPHDWITRSVGIKERREAKEGAMPSDLAIPAARNALANCPSEYDLDQIDLVIFCGIERDQPEPATAHTIQKALGLKASRAFDLANACFGFFKAWRLHQAL